MQRAWGREVAGWLAALAVALIVSGQVAASVRSELMFRDADSLIVALFSRSVLDGSATDWSMSSVLFVPESTGFALLSVLLPLGVEGVLAVSAVVNLLALYGAVRLTAGRRRAGAAPVAWSVAAVAAFGILAMTEMSPSRDALELASLQLTTTYYSATVVAVVATIGLLRRHIEAAGRGRTLLVALGAIATVSTFTNPLFAVWATAPLTLLLTALALRSSAKGRILTPLAVLLGGTALGLLLRIPFAAWIANTGVGYVRPDRWMQSLEYYGTLLGDRISTPLGVIGSLLTLTLMVIAIVRSTRKTTDGERLVLLAAWVLPVVVTVGAVALGTQAARYLQPIAFAPMLLFVATPRAFALPRRVTRQAVAALAVLLTIGAVLSIPRLSAAAQAPDADLTCVTDWVDASGRTGGGQFWTVRLPKLHLDDPARLVQVDHQLNGYAWLVDRADFAVGAVSFLIEDAQTVAWQMPVSAVPEQIIDCGRYRILDFGDALLPLGPSHG